MKNMTFLIVLTVFISSCSKMQEKKTSEDNKTPTKENQNAPKIDNNSQMENKSQGQKDEKATELVKAADDAITKYSQDKSDGNKKAIVTSCMAAANYLMFDANLPAREKYRPALKYYRKVLELDPKNEEASKNKKQIEDIYQSMGIPIPQ